MNLNQVTLPVTDFDRTVAFYRTLGLGLIVHSPPRYARDPSGNAVCLFWAGENRRNPPWRVSG